MRSWSVIPFLILLAAGCGTRPPPHASPKTGPAPGVVITPDLRTIGRVATVNEQGSFVVLRFPPGSVPRPDVRLDVFRGGLKVGELRVSSWERDNYVVADIVAGEAQVNDEAKGK